MINQLKHDLCSHGMAISMDLVRLRRHEIFPQRRSFRDPLRRGPGGDDLTT